MYWSTSLQTHKGYNCELDVLFMAEPLMISVNRKTAKSLKLFGIIFRATEVPVS